MTQEITAERIIEAYKLTGLEPVEGEWYKVGVDSKVCGCGITALAATAMDSSFAHLTVEDKERILGYIEDSAMGVTGTEIATFGDLELTGSFISGFIEAFDGGKHMPGDDFFKIRKKDDRSEYERGFNIGKEVRSIVFEEEEEI